VLVDPDPRALLAVQPPHPPGLDQALAVPELEGGRDEVRPRALETAHQVRVRRRRQGVVAVQEGDVLGVQVTQTLVASGAEALVRGVHHADAVVARGVLLGDLAGPVR